MAAYVAPRDPFELQIVSAASRRLTVPDIGIRDDLVELGMDRDAARDLADLMGAVLGRHAIPEEIIQLRVVEDIARMYRDLPRSGQWSSLTELRAGAASLPLICVHPLGGNAFWYLPLARRLNEGQSVYGLHSRGLDLAEEAQREVSVMAASYIEDLRSRIPRGPYALLGWSFGGLVAFEIARQLVALGSTVPLLAICDAGPNDALATPASLDAAFALLVHAVGLDRAAGELMALDPGERLGQLFRLSLERQRLPPGYGLAHLERMLQLNHLHLLAARSYQFGDYPHDLVLFRAVGRDADQTASASPDLGWGGIVEGKVSIYPTAGSHFDSLNRRNLHTISTPLAPSAAYRQAPNEQHPLEQNRRYLVAKALDRVAVERDLVRLLQIVDPELGQIDGSVTLDALAIDSLDLTELAIQVEAKWGAELRVDDLDGVLSIADIAQIIVERGQ
jgi:thioesterase domain-containing protein/acyl carrier protein